MMRFPILAPDDNADVRVHGAFKLADQKWRQEQEAHEHLRNVTVLKSPQSVVDAEQRKCDFAEDETARAVELFFQEYRAFRASQQDSQTTQHRLTA